jgi:WD40 repeat protein
MEWSQNGNDIALSTSDGYVRIWDAATLQLIDEVYIGNSVRAFDWLNESELVYALDDGALNVVTVENTTAQTPTSPPTSTLAPTPSLPLVNGLVAELYANPALEGSPAGRLHLR